jgi:hypothetical protein
MTNVGPGLPPHATAADGWLPPSSAPEGPVALDLAARPSWADNDVRTYATLLVLIEAVFGLFVIVLLLEGEPRPAAIGVGACIIFGGLIAWVVAPVLRGKLARRGRLVAEPGRLVIDEPAVLSEPMIVAARDVRVASLDAATGASDQAGIVLRFPIRRAASPWAPSAPSDELSGWLYTSVHGSVVPILGRRDERPNLALIFERPQPLPKLKRMSATGFVGYPPHGQARDGTPVTGLLLRVDDPGRTAEALRRDVAVRELTEHDVRDLAPVASIAARASRKVLWIGAAVTLVVVYRIALILNFIGH